MPTLVPTSSRAPSTSAPSTSAPSTSARSTSARSTSARSRPEPTHRPGRAHGAPVPLAALDLLALSRRGVIEAELAPNGAERYAAAHLAALRAAAALLAVRTRPVRRSSQRNVWVLLAQSAPELAEWAAFFAAGAGKRAAAEAGLTRVVSDREADDLTRDAETFRALVETTIGVPVQPALTAAHPGSRPASPAGATGAATSGTTSGPTGGPSRS